MQSLLALTVWESQRGFAAADHLGQNKGVKADFNLTCVVLCCALLQVAVPSVLELWLPALRQHSSRLSLRQLVSSGEGLTVDLASQLLDVLPAGCVLVNLYGETD